PVTEVHTYDQLPNGVGRLARVIDPTGKTEFQYNLRGDVVQKDVYLIGLVDTSNRARRNTFTFAYDRDGRVIAKDFPDSTSEDIAYRVDGTPLEVDFGPSSAPARPKLAAFSEYNALHQLGRKDLWGGSGAVQTTTRYDYSDVHRAQRLSSLMTTGPSSAELQ